MQQEKENKGNKPTAPLISVIVPIYNVEKYVRKCLDSLVNQTMKEIEVICIDDGSTDVSGRIADEYVSDKFPIFQVIHTGNRGLSAARNRGIDEAKAEWIMFVYSDDWVSPNFCRLPYEAAMKYDADLVCFRAYRVMRFGRIKRSKKTNTPTGLVDEMTAHEFAGWTSWNKLFKRGLFKEIRFPERHVYEDLATAHRFVNKARKIVLIPDRLYYYVDREGSISRTHTATFQRNGFVSALDRYEFLIGRGYPPEKIKKTFKDMH